MQKGQPGEDVASEIANYRFRHSSNMVLDIFINGSGPNINVLQICAEVIINLHLGK